VDVDVLAVLDDGAEGAEGVQVRVEPAAADHVSPGRRHHGRAEAGEQRAGGQERGADALGEARVDPRVAHAVGLERDGVLLQPLGAHAEVGEQREHRLDVADARDVAKHDLLLGEEAAREQRERCVLVAGWDDGAGQRHAALDEELFHGHRGAGAPRLG
jgi:hypothetical protein